MTEFMLRKWPEGNPLEAEALTVLASEKATALGWDHQLTVHRYFAEERVRTEADNLILSTFTWLLCVHETHNTPYNVSSKGEAEGREISLERLWSDMEETALLPTTAKAKKSGTGNEGGSETPQDLLTIHPGTCAVSSPLSGTHMGGQPCLNCFLLASFIHGWWTNIREQWSCSHTTTTDTQLVCSRGDENWIDELLQGSLTGSLQPLGWAL